MNAAILTGTGIGMISLAVLLFLLSLIYWKTAGRKVQEELKKEYE